MYFSAVRVFRFLSLVVAMGWSFSADAQIEWKTESSFRWHSLNPHSKGSSRFSKVASDQSGVTFVNRLAERAAAENRVLNNGGGVAVGDYDQDGLPDVFLCGLDSSSVLYRNVGGWRFVDVTDSAIGGKLTRRRSAVFADVNRDEVPDLILGTVDDGVEVYLNNGQGRFRSSEKLNSSRGSAPSTMTLADVDGNGTLDLYVANYRPSDIRDEGRINLPVSNGQVVVPDQYKGRLFIRDGQVMERGQADQLYLNDGAGKFTPVPWDGGAFLDSKGGAISGALQGWGLCAAFRDVNGDGLPDLYVCNDYWTPDEFWINQGGGVFRALDPLAMRKMSASSMGIDFADIDRDGDCDFFVVDMLSRNPQLRKRQQLAQMPEHDSSGRIDFQPQEMRNTLFRNRGDTTFQEVAEMAGVAASDWSWTPIFIDVDFDGFQDLLISAGHFKDTQDEDINALIKTKQKTRGRNMTPAEVKAQFVEEMVEHNRLYPALDMPIVAYHNLRDGRFAEKTEDWGLGELAVHHGMATGDFDLDGDLDLVVNNLNSRAAFYRNDASEPRVSVRLIGRRDRVGTVGAKVYFDDGSDHPQFREAFEGGRYLSDSDSMFSFAFGSDSKPKSIIVVWRNGDESVVEQVVSGRSYEVFDDQASAPQIASEEVAPANPMFRDVSELIDYEHREPPFDDFAIQSLLPFKLSQQGPVGSWMDLNDDGRLDILIGGSRGGSVSVYLDDGDGRYKESISGRRLRGDVVAVLSVSNGNGGAIGLAAVSGFESGAGSTIDAVRLEKGKIVQESVIKGLPAGIGTVVAGDYDGDGDDDLFIGGGPFPGRYPDAGRSFIYRNTAEGWQLDAASQSVIGVLGVVRGAAWMDFDGDGDLDLITAGEWQPVRVFRNEKGKFAEVTATLGVAPFVGLWQCLACGDFNGDGLTDVFAGNWGLNSSYQASQKRPYLLVYGDFGQRRRNEILETEYDNQGRLIVSRSFGELAGAMPFLYDRYSSFKQFSRSSVAEVLADRGQFAKQLGATTFESTMFYRRANGYDAVPLPLEAQVSVASGAAVLDVNRDGVDDLVLAQNAFESRRGLSRQDSGLGILLLGNRGEKPKPVPAELSGIRVYGNQKSVVAGAEKDSDRLRLLWTQNGSRAALLELQR